MFIGSISAISRFSILYSNILSKLSWVIGEPDFKKTLLSKGFARSFLVYFPRKKSEGNKIFFKPSSNNFFAITKLILEPFWRIFFPSLETRSFLNFIGRL